MTSMSVNVIHMESNGILTVDISHYVAMVKRPSGQWEELSRHDSATGACTAMLWEQSMGFAVDSFWSTPGMMADHLAAAVQETGGRI